MIGNKIYIYYAHGAFLQHDCTDVWNACTRTSSDGFRDERIFMSSDKLLIHESAEFSVDAFKVMFLVCNEFREMRLIIMRRSPVSGFIINVGFEGSHGGISSYLFCCISPRFGTYARLKRKKYLDIYVIRDTKFA